MGTLFISKQIRKAFLFPRKQENCNYEEFNNYLWNHLEKKIAWEG